MWQHAHKPNLEKFNANTGRLTQAEQLNTQIASYSVFNHLNKSRKLVQMLNLIAQIDRINQVEVDLDQQDLSEVLETLTSLRIDRAVFDFLDNDETNSQQFDLDRVIDSLKTLLIKSQLLPVREYLRVLDELTQKFENTRKKLGTVNNLIELSSRQLVLGQAYSLFTRTNLESFKFIDILIDLVSENNRNELEPANIDASTSVLRQKLGQNYRNFQMLSQAGRNILNFNWLDTYSMSVYSLELAPATSGDTKTSMTSSRSRSSSYTRPVELVMTFYDERVRRINELSELLWINYDKLASHYVGGQLERQIGDEFAQHLNLILAQQFDSNPSAFEEYLVRKGASREFMSHLEKQSSSNQQVRLIRIGYLVAYLFAPVEPMDPLEHGNLVEANQLDTDEIRSHESETRRNNACKLKFYERERDESQQQRPELATRRSKSDYFGVKNELENALRQFCAPRQLEKFISGASRPEEYRTYLISLQNFVDKLYSEHFSLADILYPPVNGLSLVGYAISAIYTRSLRSSSSYSNDLIQLLLEFPYKSNEYISRAKTLLDYSQHADVPVQLADELNVLVLLNLLASLKCETSSSSSKQQREFSQDVHSTFWKVCWYFAERYKSYKQARDERENVEAYKYKEYGQKETQNELDAIEYEQHFPSFEHNYQDFVLRDVLTGKMMLILCYFILIN